MSGQSLDIRLRDFGLKLLLGASCLVAAITTTSRAIASEVLGESESIPGVIRQIPASPREAAVSFDKSMSSPACQAFKGLLLPNPQGAGSGLNSDQIVAIRDGQTLFDWSDGVVHKNTPREMWSVSKTITATLIATAVQQGKLKLDDPVIKYLPWLLSEKNVDRTKLSEVKIRDLLSMTSGFRWTENPKAPINQQSDLSLLFSRGYPDLVKFIAHVPFAAEPGEKWNYSSVNAILAMAVLRHAYGEEYSDMPWNNLFRPLGMDSARFEKDRAGDYVGAAYIYLSARDLAKVGELYLHDGIWNGTRLLPENWVKSMAMNPAPQSMHGAESFAETQAYSQGGFWINRDTSGKGKALQHAPANMIVASGLFGQALLIFPDQNLIIARTAHDGTGTTLPTDAIAADATRCFASDAQGVTSKKAVWPAPPPAPTLDLKGAVDALGGLNFTLDNGSLSGMLAKELCSCHFVSGLTVAECLARSPLPPMAASLLVDINPDEVHKTMTVYPHVQSVTAQAQFNTRSPREGCKLTYGYADAVAAAPRR